MPTQRPFFSNFLAAFRAQTALQKAATSTTTSSASASAAQSSFASSHSGAPTATSTLAAASAATRSLSTKASPQSAAAAAASSSSSSIAIHQSGRQFQPTRQHTSASPYSRSPGSPAGTASSPVGGYAGRQRRGSDSSSEGFKDALGGEKWYIGGRAPNGEERFYRLGVVKRPRSIDRLSTDRLSL